MLMKVTRCLKILKCDAMGQNQSHVAKHKRAEILSENVKLCPFFVSIKNKIFV